MTSDSFTMSTQRGAGYTLLTMLLLVAPASSHAQANAIPANWSFEAEAPGTAIVDTNGVGILGWTGSSFTASNHAAEVVAITPPSPSGGYPLPSETHNNVIRILGDVQTTFNTNSALHRSYANVYIDWLVQAGQLTVDEPDIPDGIQVAGFFTTNGLLKIYHANYTNSFNPVLNRYWTELQHTPVGSNDWVRLTICMDYLSAPSIFQKLENFFAIQLNGQILSHPTAYLSPVLDDPGDGNFPQQAGAGETNMWFLNADSGFGDGLQASGNVPNNAFLTAVEFSGLGHIDDLVVMTNFPSFGPPPPLTPFEIWIAQFSVGAEDGPGDDPDEDGATNWEEYLAGTSASDPNDVFKIIVEEYMNGTNCVTWLSSTNSGVFTTFTLYRATNLIEDVWTPIASNIVRDASGTNLWYDNNAPDGQAYYYPALPSTTNQP